VGDGCEDGSVVGSKEGDFERLGASDAAIVGASLENTVGAKETEGTIDGSKDTDSSAFGESTTAGTVGVRVVVSFCRGVSPPELRFPSRSYVQILAISRVRAASRWRAAASRWRNKSYLSSFKLFAFVY
jgi:hypothetical protein